MSACANFPPSPDMHAIAASESQPLLLSSDGSKLLSQLLVNLRRSDSSRAVVVPPLEPIKPSETTNRMASGGTSDSLMSALAHLASGFSSRHRDQNQNLPAPSPLAAPPQTAGLGLMSAKMPMHMGAFAPGPMPLQGFPIPLSTPVATPLHAAMFGDGLSSAMGIGPQWPQWSAVSEAPTDAFRAHGDRHMQPSPAPHAPEPSYRGGPQSWPGGERRSPSPGLAYTTPQRRSRTESPIHPPNVNYPVCFQERDRRGWQFDDRPANRRGIDIDIGVDIERRGNEWNHDGRHSRRRSRSPLSRDRSPNRPGRQQFVSGYHALKSRDGSPRGRRVSRLRDHDDVRGPAFGRPPPNRRSTQTNELRYNRFATRNQDKPQPMAAVTSGTPQKQIAAEQQNIAPVSKAAVSRPRKRAILVAVTSLSDANAKTLQSQVSGSVQTPLPPKRSEDKNRLDSAKPLSSASTASAKESTGTNGCGAPLRRRMALHIASRLPSGLLNAVKVPSECTAKPETKPKPKSKVDHDRARKTKRLRGKAPAKKIRREPPFIPFANETEIRFPQ